MYCFFVQKMHLEAIYNKVIEKNHLSYGTLKKNPSMLSWQKKRKNLIEYINKNQRRGKTGYVSVCNIKKEFV